MTGTVVGRRALFDRLAGASRVTQITAPPGSGKTMLVRSWIGEAGLAERAGWVSVLRQERDAQRFWISVIGALGATAAGSTRVRGLTPAPDLDGWAVVERLLEDLGSLEGRVWLVIDDLHELRSAEALSQLELLVMRSPGQLRFVLVTRHDQRLGLHRLRLEGGLTEIRAADLRFTLAEARALLDAPSHARPRRLPHETAGRIRVLRVLHLCAPGRHAARRLPPCRGSVPGHRLWYRCNPAPAPRSVSPTPLEAAPPPRRRESGGFSSSVTRPKSSTSCRSGFKHANRGTGQ